MSEYSEYHIILWLRELEDSALIRTRMSSIQNNKYHDTIENVIANQIAILEHYAWEYSGLGLKSDELRCVIELDKNFRTSDGSAPPIKEQKLAGLEAIMTAEFKRLDAAAVASDLKYYTLLRTSVLNKNKALSHLDDAIDKGLELMETKMAAKKKVRSGIRDLD